MKSISSTWTGLLLMMWLASIATPAPVRAERNPINLSKFGYGARIDPWGVEADSALEAASDAALDWISIDFDWDRRWPDQAATLNLAELNRAMQYARDHGLQVLISIRHAPAWARTSQGPDPQLTAGLVVQLSRLYPDSLLAVELFPSANTLQGWGARPNPEAYVNLLETTSQKLKSAGRPAVLVAAGLEPVLASKSSSNMDDLTFLQKLYEAGAKEYLSIIGIRIPPTEQAPMAAPWKSDPQVLRHYESVRSVMLKNQHPDGRIWITSFSMPGLNSSASNRSDGMVIDDQVSWFNQAVPLMKSQLYIGAVFYGCMNPSLNDQTGIDESSCLIQRYSSGTGYHPAFLSFCQMISLDKYSTLTQSSLDKRAIQTDHKTLLKLGAP